jgi:hypothetical protein
VLPFSGKENNLGDKPQNKTIERALTQTGQTTDTSEKPEHKIVNTTNIICEENCESLCV